MHARMNELTNEQRPQARTTTEQQMHERTNEQNKTIKHARTTEYDRTTNDRTHEQTYARANQQNNEQRNHCTYNALLFRTLKNNNNNINITNHRNKYTNKDNKPMNKP